MRRCRLDLPLDFIAEALGEAATPRDWLNPELGYLKSTRSRANPGGGGSSEGEVRPFWSAPRGPQLFLVRALEISADDARLAFITQRRSSDRCLPAARSCSSDQARRFPSI